MKDHLRNLVCWILLAFVLMVIKVGGWIEKKLYLLRY